METQDKFQQLLKQVEEQIKQHKEKEEQRKIMKNPQSLDFGKFFLDPDSQEYINDETCGFQEHDLQSTIRVLRALSAPDKKLLIRHEKFNQFRKALRNLIGSGQDKSEFIKKTLKDPKLAEQVSDLCCEMRVKKNNEKDIIRQQLQIRNNYQDIISGDSHFGPNKKPLSLMNGNQLEQKQYLNVMEEPRMYFQGYERKDHYQKECLIKFPKPDQNEVEQLLLNNQSNELQTLIEELKDSELAQDEVRNEKIKQILRSNLKVQRNCYTCQKSYNKLHHFYDQMCQNCGDLNFYKRTQTCNLQGKIALVTGGRIKIGYQIILILLRNGAHTIVTTRYPKDAAMKLRSEPDFDKWCDRLEIYGLDFKYIPSIYEFCDFMKKKYNRLDILINNAAQTIRREPSLNEPIVRREFETDLISDEALIKILPADFKNQRLDQFLIQQGQMPQQAAIYDKEKLEELKEHELQKLQNFMISKSSLVSRLKFDASDDFEQETQVYDVNNDLIDFRTKNSWVRELDEVSLSEFMEVYMINATAPFIICTQLKPLMERSPQAPRFIVNVSAMEGQFYKRFKNSTHPHTNMAKAALNMMTRTCGSYYALSHIYMNAADTGWVTDENPRAYETQRTVPIDEIDGAMRVVDCIFMGYNYEELKHSRFFKDYKECYW